MSDALLVVQDLVKRYTLPREGLFAPAPVNVGAAHEARCIRVGEIA